MIKNRFNNNDNLIIADIEQRELENKNSLKSVNLFLEPILQETEFLPFVSKLPILLGLSIKTLGNTIYQAKVKKNYFCNDIEQKITSFDINNALKTIRNIKPSNPLFYQISFTWCVEKIFALEISVENKLKRSIGLEINKIFHNLVILENMFDYLKINSLKNICAQILKQGKILFSLYNDIEDNNKNITIINAKEIIKQLLFLSNNLEILSFNSEFLYVSLKNKAKININQACDLGLTGKFLQACKNISPINDNIYVDEPPHIPLRDEADAYARCLLRIEETKSSLLWLHKNLKSLSNFDDSLKNLFFTLNLNLDKPKENFAFFEIASPEGDLKSSIFINKDESIIYRITSPAYFIANSIPSFLINENIDNLIIILISLGIEASEIDK